MHIAILGSGVAGCIAARAIHPHHDIIMIEPMREPSSALAHHGAVMRVKDPAIALLLGCSIDAITVHKGIWRSKELRNTPTLQDNNMYSVKLYGYVGNKSIFNYSENGERRFLLRGKIEPPCDVIYDKGIGKIQNNNIYSAPDGRGGSYKYDFCISTLPMPVNCKLTGIDCSEIQFVTSAITSLYFKTGCDTTDSYQTIYYPEFDTPLYRATLQDGIIIAETLGYNPEKHLRRLGLLIKDSFQISIDSDPIKSITQNSGKLSVINEDVRKEIIYSLTTEHNILSMGRYAIWKPIRTDSLLGDIKFIKSLMESRERYKVMKERGGG